MVQLSHISAGPHSNPKSLDSASVELRQLLSRLQRNLLHPDPERERRLRASEYERARISSNLDYARTVLTKLEQEALAIKAPARRIETQGALTQQRELLDLLLDRLHDLREIAVDEDDDDSSDGEDLLSGIVQTQNDSFDSIPNAISSEEPFHDEAPPEPIPVEPRTTKSTQPPPTTPETSQTSQPSPSATASATPTQTSQTLRARPSAPQPATSTPAHTTARAALFANRRRPGADGTSAGAAAAAPPHTSTATAEAILDHQRAEQDNLSESILKMAGALKASSHKFSDTLEADAEVVGRAGEGMEKTERGMEAAHGRMGALRRMTEGKGWWGRMILYAWVYGLMVFLLLVVFVFPKLRF